jgi:hypothetical protein
MNRLETWKILGSGVVNGTKRSTEISVLRARHMIFNKLCSAYRRSGQDPYFCLLAYDVMVELSIPRNVFAEALDGFVDVAGELIVEMFERKGERYIRLGQTAKYNCSDWPAPLELFFFGFER